jgi:hypothetical protein
MGKRSAKIPAKYVQDRIHPADKRLGTGYINVGRKIIEN